MKAFLLAGGRGERLRPLTDDTPKCLVPVGGAPVLQHWLEWCDHHGIDDVLVNVSVRPDRVRTFLAEYRGGPRVTLRVEPSPLGSAGTVAANRAFVAGESEFLVVYTDNVTTLGLGPMLAAHRRHRGVMTMLLFHAPDPTAAGIVTLDEGGRVTRFVEKPSDPDGDLANAGVYVARAGLFEAIPEVAPPVDFGHHVLPRLVGRMYGYVTDEFLMDIGTPDALRRAREMWPLVVEGRP